MLDEFDKPQQGSGLAAFVYYGVWISVIMLSGKMKSFYHSRKFNIVYTLFFVGLLLDYIFPPGAISLSRPFRYFYIFQTIILAYFAYFLIHYRRMRYHKVYSALLIGLFVGIFYMSILTAGNDSHVFFQFCFNHPETQMVPRI